MPPSNKKQSKSKPAKRINSSSLPLSTDPPLTGTDYTASFATFICLADLSDIKHFCEAAGSSQESINLRAFWGRAFAEGRKVGQKEEYNRGYDAGYNEGYSDACEKDYEAGLATSTKAGVSTTEIGTQTTICMQTTPEMNTPVTTVSISTQTNPTTSAATSESSAPSKNEKNSKTQPISENLTNITVFSSATPSMTIVNPVEPSTTTTALEAGPTTVVCIPNQPKVEKPPIFGGLYTPPPIPADSAGVRRSPPYSGSVTLGQYWRSLPESAGVRQTGPGLSPADSGRLDLH
jgi:hypothetical protein